MKESSESMESATWIAGISCRLPDSKNIEEFWENLKNKQDMIDEHRWPVGLYDIPSRAGLIPDIDKFDSYYFGYTETEAQNVNPMLWHLLEVTSECIIDSGLSLETLQNNLTGLYTACFIPDFDFIETSRCANSRLCTTASMISGHLKDHFRLVGPMLTVDTACSSSLSALEMAVTDLQIGKCQYAIVTAVNLLLMPNLFQQMTALGMLNPTGESNVFDANAGGYVRAEGVVSILLTRRFDTCKRVYMKIVDVKTNTDGYKADGITFPSSKSQAKLMREIYDKNGVDMSQIVYFEAHSTGTRAGDPVEIAGITEAICSQRIKPLLVGSVKSNMGHSEATTGLASLTKCILAARYGSIPSQLNFNVPNPKIESLTTGKVKIVDKMMPLEDGFIGLNSFGFGGANGHAILKPFISSKAKEQRQQYSLVPVTARSQEEMLTIADFVSKHADDNDVLSLLGGSLLSCDTKRPIRGYIITGPDNAMTERIGDPSVIRPCGVWIMFQDIIWDSISCSKDLVENPAFIDSINESQEILLEISTEYKTSDFSILDILSSDQPCFTVSSSGLSVAMATMIGLVDSLKACGVPITGAIGCGITELAAAYVDNCLSRKQCLQLAFIIGKALEDYTKENEPSHSLYLVTLEYSKAYLLGPKTQILSVLSETKCVAVVAKDHIEKVLRIIHENGGYYQEMQHNIPVYSKLLNEDLCNRIKDDIKPVLVNPKLSSSFFLSCHRDIRKSQLYNRAIRFDAQYVCDMLRRCVTGYSVLPCIPSTDVVVNVTLGTTELNLGSSDIVYSPSDTVDNTPRDTIQMKPCQNSFLQALGELHLRGHKIDIFPICDTKFPLDVHTPSISHLVKWDHSTTFTIPSWTEYCCTVKNDAVCHYTIDSIDVEGIHAPVSLLIYHAWMAISQRHAQNTDSGPVPGVELEHLVLPIDVTNLAVDMLIGAVCQVQTGRQKFTVHNDGDLLLSGSYKLHREQMKFPKIPGYDLDINKNIEPIDEDMDIQKSEIIWEDSWLDFFNDTLEYAMQYLTGPLVKIMIDPQQHTKIVQDCASVLAVVEPNTGLCKAGGLMVQIQVTRQKNESHQKSISIDEANKTLITTAMVYNIGVNNEDMVLLYQGENQVSKDPVMGLVLITDSAVSCREISFKSKWQPEELEQIIPYLLAFYIVNEVAEVKDGSRILVCPPIDTLGVYIMALASQYGCSVFTSTYDIELRQLIESIFPFVRVLPGERLNQNIKTLTQGEGCDVCIKFTGRGLSEIADLISEDGKMIQCSPVIDHRESITLNSMSKNRSLLMPDLRNCFKDLMMKTDDDLQAILYDIQNGSISKLSSEGFPESKGLLYSMEEKSSFLHPVSLSRLLSVLDEPGLTLKDGICDMMEADVIAMERLHNVIISKPRDYSLAVENVSLAVNVNHISDVPDGGSIDELNTAKNQTFSGLCSMMSNEDSPKIIVIPGITVSPDGKQRASTVHHPPTSTPLITVTELSTGKQDSLHESYIEQQTPEAMQPAVKSLLAPRPKVTLSLSIPSSISSFMPKKDKDGRHLDLLFVGPPKTPMTPAVKDLLTPSRKEPTIIPLNDVIKSEEKPVYLFHSVIGKLTLLESLGKLLSVPCYGVQRTTMTPLYSVSTNASYIRNAIQMSQSIEPYYLIGYSYGGILALEVAMQMQADNKKVGSLVILDGGPGYLHAQIDKGLQSIPENSPESLKDSIIEVGALVFYLGMLGKLPPNKSTLFKILLNLQTQDERIDFVVDMSFGHVELSTNTYKTKWMAAKHKLAKRGDIKSPYMSKTKSGIYNAAQEILRLKRHQTALECIKSVKNGYRYKQEGRKFKGDIHLLRIKSDPPDAVPIAVDYGLKDWCTGNVHVKFYDGTHETFVNVASGKAVAEEITRILKA